MTYLQIAAILRILVPVLLTYMIGQHWIPVDTPIDQAVTAVITIGSILWSFSAHSPAALVRAVKRMPEVRQILLRRSAGAVKLYQRTGSQVPGHALVTMSDTPTS